MLELLLIIDSYCSYCYYYYNSRRQKQHQWQQQMTATTEDDGSDDDDYYYVGTTPQYINLDTPTNIHSTTVDDDRDESIHNITCMPG